MKRLIALLLCMILVAVAVYASADPARFYNDDKNQSYHTEHLRLHIGSKNCKGSGNYLKVRSEAGGKKVVGHLEMADTFTLDEISGNWAKITVTRASKYSTDSHNEMTGWVDADYIECPCSSEEYYANKPRLTYSLAVTTQKTTHLREHPSKTTSSFSQLSKGEQVEIISEYTGKDKKLWYRVRSAKGVMGYVRSDLLEITETGIAEELPDLPVATEAPVTEPPVTEPPVTEAPITPIPITEAPVTPVPVTEAPATPVPVTEVPVTEVPVTEVPVTEVPATPVPVTKVPVTEAPATEALIAQNIMTIIPDQSLPMPDEVEGDSAGRTTGSGDDGLENLNFASEGMWDANVNREKYFCFTISCSTGSGSPIELYRWDTETLIGTMVDDGTNGDETPGDGIYSFGFTAVGTDWGRAQFIAKQDDLWSNDVIVHFYNPDSRDSADYIAILMDALRSVTSQDPYAEGGIISLVKNQYLLGTVSEYYIENGVIRYHEAHTGYAMESSIAPPAATATPETTDTGASDQVFASWQEAYHDFVFMERYYSRIVREDAAGAEYADPFGNSYFDEDTIWLGLYDLNQDGIPELLTTEGYVHDSGLNCAYVYSFRDGHLVYVGSMPNRVFGPCVTGESDYQGLVTASGNNGFSTIEYYTMDNNYNLLSNAVYEEDYNAPNDPEQTLDEPMITVITSDQRFYEIARSSRYHDLFQFDQPSMETEEIWEDFLLTATTDWTMVSFRENDSPEEIEEDLTNAEPEQFGTERVEGAEDVTPDSIWSEANHTDYGDFFNDTSRGLYKIVSATGTEYTNVFPENYGDDLGFWYYFYETAHAEKRLFFGNVGTTPRELCTVKVSWSDDVIHICVPEVPAAIKAFADEYGYNILKVYNEKHATEFHTLVTGSSTIFFYKDWFELSSAWNNRKNNDGQWYVGFADYGYPTYDPIYAHCRGQETISFAYIGSSISYWQWKYSEGYRQEMGYGGGTYHDEDFERIDTYEFRSRSSNAFVRYSNAGIAMSDDVAEWMANYMRSHCLIVNGTQN